MQTPTAEATEGATARRRERRRWWPPLAVVLVGGLLLRLWGLQQGLPYAFNVDEGDHFLPRAVKMFAQGTLNPHYFANPPAFTYLLHFLFAIAYGGGEGVQRAFALHPAELYTLGRIAAAVLGTLALWLLYATGARLFGRAVGVLAAAIEAVAFLPVYYAHLALNDVPTLAPLTLSLLGTAGVLRRGRAWDYLLAGVGLGLACASKYTAGIVVLPLAAAAGAQLLARHADSREGADGPGRTLAGCALALLAALAAFLLANPYALLAYGEFHADLVHQSTLSAEAQGKLGAPKEGGLVYYLWSLTWGLGWLPALAALGGALAVWRSHRRVGWLLVPAPVLFILFMGLEGRYFGRWLLPIFPILCLLGAYLVVALIERGTAWIARPRATALAPGRAAATEPAEPGARPERGRRAPRVLGVCLGALLVAALLAQGLLYSVHSGLVLSRADTRNLTRQWMLANVPKGAKIVAEPVSPNEWAREDPGAADCPHYRWCKYPSLFLRISPSGALLAGVSHEVGLENYVTTLAPALIGYYERNGFCWVISGSTQSGRAFADPRAAPLAIAYYRALARQGEVVHRVSPYSRGQGPVSFGFDWSFDYYPLAYSRPGPAMTVYRLHGGRCAGR